ncbi:sensor histidine kinase [Silvibacterium acidisoli]|uniref:sensor histidine kinase n=1 Tax=Acidobacteriaceae bacterium ZG23-2 TaxID=2883246 RepID=UPI00406C834B
MSSRKHRPALLHPVVFLSGWVLLACLFAAQEYVADRSWNHTLSFGYVFELWAFDFILWGVICLVMWWKLRERIETASSRCIVLYVVPLSLLVSVLQEAIWVACFPNVPVRAHSWTYLHRLRYYLDSELVSNLVIFWIMFFLFRGIGYYQRLREKEVASVRLESELNNAQLRALRMQLNPHFLFNTLNSVSSLMHSDVDDADRVLEQLSSMLRMTLNRGEAKFITLTEEIEFIQMYLSIQQTRFTGKVHSYVAVEPEVLDALVPTMILQPLMENAYFHGVAKTKGEAFLGIEAQRSEGQLRICVRNSGTGLRERADEPIASDGHEGHGVGIANVKARLELHYGNHHRFSLNEFSDGEVHAVLMLPLTFSSSPTVTPAEVPEYIA